VTATIPERIARGAALLDEKLPGWVDQIDLDRLDLGSPCRCILGQTWDGGTIPGYSRFETHANALGLGDDEEIEHGFNASGGDYFEDAPEYRALTAEWKRVILARLAGAR
jgi:hypothetical protein